MAAVPAPVAAPVPALAAAQVAPIPDADPWGTSGGRLAAAQQLRSQMGKDPSNFYRDKLQSMASGQFSPDDPSYQFRLQQGQQALERSAAAKGMLGSGNAAIELQQYGQQAASSEYGAQFSRMLQGLSGVEAQYSSQMSRLSELAGIKNDPLASTTAQQTQQKINNDFTLGSYNARTQYGLGLGSNANQAQSIANNYSLGKDSNSIQQQNAYSQNLLNMSQAKSNAAADALKQQQYIDQYGTPRQSGWGTFGSISSSGW